MGAALLFAAPTLLVALALLLSPSRPSRFIPACIAGIAALLSLYWLATTGALPDQTAKAWTLIATTLFAVIAYRGEGSAADGAIGAGLIATVAVFGWYLALRLPMDAGVFEAQRAARETYLLLGDRFPAYRGLAVDFAESANGLLRLLPGMMVVVGMGALLVAWRWYHILADAPVGVPPLPFRELRFSDHLLWLLVLGLGGTVAQLAGYLPPEELWPGNVLVMAGGLYCARGAAVLAPSTERWPFGLLLGAWFTVLFLAPIAFTGLLGVGVADTWLDFRRRAAVASGE
ncbi:MAG: hypothetical protein JF590_03865 [Gemmatimonadetes bacterium]|nr:hypothetical protein [Gemmatimonadota bacterium]